MVGRSGKARALQVSDGGALMRRWIDWACAAQHVPTRRQEDEVWDRCGRGEEPPEAPMTPDWPSDDKAAAPAAAGASR